MQWYWLTEYAPQFLRGLWVTFELLGLAIVFGMALAIPIGLVQVTGPRSLAWLARAFCTTIRGTPLLIQLWLVYYALPTIPGISDSFIWPVLEPRFVNAILVFSLSVAAYEGEVMRGAFRGVPRGELEAARAFGMRPLIVLRRIWLPRALQNVFPTLAGEMVLTLKATPLAATIGVVELYGVSRLVSAETFRTYEPLVLVAAIYLCFTAVIVLAFRWAENRIPRVR